MLHNVFIIIKTEALKNSRNECKSVNRVAPRALYIIVYFHPSMVVEYRDPFKCIRLDKDISAPPVALSAGNTHQPVQVPAESEANLPLTKR